MNKNEQIVVKINPSKKGMTIRQVCDIKRKYDLRKASLYQIFGPQYRHIVQLEIGGNRQNYAVYNEETFQLDFNSGELEWTNTQ